jgi:hypothetical protein
LLDEVSRQCRQSFVLTLCRAILDPQAAARANASLDQPLLKGSRQRQWRSQPFV